MNMKTHSGYVWGVKREERACTEYPGEAKVEDVEGVGQGPKPVRRISETPKHRNTEITEVRL